MWRLITRQALSGLLSLFLLVTGVFLLLRLFGDPTPLIIPDGTPAQVAEVRRGLGLDRSIPAQLLEYYGQLVRGDLGISYYSRLPVLPTILNRLGTSALLVLGGMAFAVLIGVPLGVLAAVRRGTFVDRAISVVTILGQSMPTFWTGLVLILFFSVNLRWLPAFGVQNPLGWILPIVTIGVFGMARFTRIMRVSLLEELGTDYLRTARSKGLPERKVLAHAVRNALIPVMTMLGFRVAELITGSVVIEQVFSIPGMGQMLVNDGIFRRDFPIVQAAILMAAGLVIAINVATEWLYALVDPRIQL